MSNRRSKDSHVLRVAERSNGLAFSHHHFLSASSSATTQKRFSVLSQIDGNAPARPRVSLTPLSEHTKEDITVFRQQIRSLIPPMTSIRSKTEPNTIRRHRRNSSSSASIKSFTPSMLSRKRRSAMVQTPSLATMPAEILSFIFQHLHQHDLHSLMLANSNFIEVAASYMYTAPNFASTYRFAQFTYTVSHRPHYASMVRSLDLSYFAKEVGGDGELPPLAGWREFKYRQHDLYYVRALNSPPSLPLSSPANRSQSGQGRRYASHPPPSPFLKSFHRTRDVPIGGICHVLAACTRLQRLNLSRLQLASDFIVISPYHPSSLLPSHDNDIWGTPFPASNLTFVSDVPKSWTWQSSELVAVYADEIIAWLGRLGELESLKARGCVWLTTDRLLKLFGEVPGGNRDESGTKGDGTVMREERRKRGLKRVDFRESGMQKDVRWAIKGDSGLVARIVREVLENTKE